MLESVKGKMAKILFIPSAFNEIPTIAMVRAELEPALKDSLLAISLDETLEVRLQENAFPCKRFAEYQARNALDLLKKENPGLVLTNDWDDTTRAFVYAAAHLGIPVLQVDDGVTFAIPTKYGSVWYSPNRLTPRRILRWLKNKQRFNRWRDLVFMFRTLQGIRGLLPALFALGQEIDHRFPRPTIDHLRYAVAGQSAKDAYVQRGVAPDNVYVTGQPRFDALLKREFNGERLRTKLGIPGDKGIIVLATQHLAGGLRTEEKLRDFVEIVVRAASQFPNHVLVVKPHPQEDEEFYRRILMEMGETKVVVRQKVDIYQLLHACDLLITGHSTVALEAMLLGKPVLTINLTGKPDLMPYASSGAAIGVYQKKDLVPAMTDALFNAQARNELARCRQAFVIEHAYKADGQASKMVAEVISRLIKEHRK